MGCGYVGTLTAELHLPEAGSLKDKRKPLLRVKADLQKRFSCAVAEVDHHELHRRTRLTLAVVTREAGECRRLLDAAERRLADDPSFVLIAASTDIVAVEHTDAFLRS